VNELAELASISVGGLYRYIGTKSDLLEMICDELNLGVIPAMRAAAAEQTSHAEKLRAAFSVYWDRVWEYSSSISVAYREFIHFPDEFKQRHTKEQAEIAGTFSEIIRAGIADGTFADVDAYALSYQMLLLSHIRVLKGWALREYDKSSILEENMQLVLARLEPR
jgi:AcrR family transcriptional regulator